MSQVFFFVIFFHSLFHCFKHIYYKHVFAFHCVNDEAQRSFTIFKHCNNSVILNIIDFILLWCVWSVYTLNLTNKNKNNNNNNNVAASCEAAEFLTVNLNQQFLKNRFRPVYNCSDTPYLILGTYKVIGPPFRYLSCTLSWKLLLATIDFPRGDASLL
jgi:hypothetical protein